MSSCDPAHMIVLKNNSGGKAFYRYTNTDTDTARVISIEIPSAQPNNEVNIFFGFGLWNERTIRVYAEKTRFIEVVSPKDSMRITDKDQMVRFLKAGRGHAKGRLTVEIK